MSSLLSTLRSAALTTLLSTLTALGVVQLTGCATNGASAGAQHIAVDARPNGIAVRPADGTVFLTDDATGSILASADGHTFAHYASIPAGPSQGNSLSQLAFVAPQTLLAERFGFGSASAIFSVGGKDEVRALTGTNPARRRLGLAVIAPGMALSTWFVKSDEQQPAQGGMSLVTYDLGTGTATERDLMTGLAKPVGVVVSGKTVFVSDQTNNVIVSAPLDVLLAAPQPVTLYTVTAHVNGPDLLAVDESGTLYTKCDKTAFCKIAQDATVTHIADGLHDARGAAIDPSRHLLYVVDRAASGGTSYVQIIPLR
jgi:DNA-binding beta-propeller fold protein YncE